MPGILLSLPRQIQTHAKTKVSRETKPHRVIHCNDSKTYANTSRAWLHEIEKKPTTMKWFAQTSPRLCFKGIIENFNGVIDLFRQRSPPNGSGRNEGIGSVFLASYLHHWKLPSELLVTAVFVRINWRFFEFTGKIRCCCFRICTFQYFLLFNMITTIYLLGRCVR